MKHILITSLFIILAFTSCEKSAEIPDSPKKPDTQIIESTDFTLKVDRINNRVEIVEPSEMSGVYAEFTDTGAYLVTGEYRLSMNEIAAEGWRRWLD